MSMKVLIAGCGRSGTLYTAEVLVRCGVKVLHHHDGVDGTVLWTPVGIPGFDFDRYDNVFHQVRHPLKTIASCATIGVDSWNLIHRCTGIDLSLPVILRSALYWVLWNLLTEQVAQWRFRVEYMPDVLPELLRRLGVGEMSGHWQDVPVDTNSRKHPDVSWSHLMSLSPIVAENVRRLACRYGYEVG